MILNAVAAKAVCLGEALKPEFRLYATQVLHNARVLAATLIENRMKPSHPKSLLGYVSEFLQEPPGGFRKKNSP